MAGQVTPAQIGDVLASFRKTVLEGSFLTEVGRVVHLAPEKIVAVAGACSIGDTCRIADRATGREVLAQVISIEGQHAILSPFTSIDGLSVNADVINTGKPLAVPVGDQLIGRIVDSMCQPLDGGPAFMQSALSPVRGQWISPLERTVIDTVFETGIRSVDIFNTVGMGQRMAILGEPGAGKSTLLSMLARHAQADVVVIAMIGERGREVREFIDRQLPPEVVAKCVTVVATSDRSPIERAVAGHTALTIAEDFRNRGRNVLLLFDSVTRFARALREVGLAAGEVAVRQGYTPSVYSELPKLFERCGKTSTGSITGFFTVLLENEGVNDAISEEVVSLADGHIRLDAKLASAGQYPAIDVLKSKSRLMQELAERQHLDRASYIRSLISKFAEIELLVQVGEYQAGHDDLGDAAIRARPYIKALLSQPLAASIPIENALYHLEQVIDAVHPPQDQAA